MLILIGRGLDLKEELELGRRSEARAEWKLKVVARKFEVNFHCAVFRVWKSRAETERTQGNEREKRKSEATTTE